ncbi:MULTISPECIES: Crp/Fnr family transcriptional regulator [unclassified Dehalobacter]|uniref:Crp/Fnr family transcriptional regulator n=1 Tax=unclassified Dehalobacter TaxID=2635733 RepID=UPI000E6C9DF4|nr:MULTISPECIES: Crp/Fnr family transcriptional regulator [unclassified Dehalobacter]RJE48956.1 cyclic nucleotide-binding protein [Dehalobacter sp. MCB1]TCX50758.1 Crp/Fnr family transcriptional regulator [Dehalobacter sp. 12DCB1]TCX51693.1 Crp/Fnr family transcriptional regulator [Dehalobacter sp. 14DCB1]
MYTVDSCVYLQWVDPPVGENVIDHAMSKGIKMLYKKGTTILHEGEMVHNAHFVSKGWAAYYLHNLHGESRIACLVGPKRVFGLGPTFDKLPINFSVKAIEDCEIYLVSRADLIQAMVDDLELGIEMVANVTKRLRCVFEGANIFSSLSSPRERLIYFFVSLLQSRECKEHGDWFELPVNLSHERIGEIIGASRVTISRIISKYKITGKLKSCKNKLYVHRELILEEYGEIGI